MQMAVYKSVCPLNCFDSCVLMVEVRDGKVTKVTGDPEHPYTRGTVCSKAHRQVERLYSPDRVRVPLRKTASGWQKISWDDALDLMTEKLDKIAGESGTTAVLHSFDSGSNGLLNDLVQRFFNAYGGVTTTYGSLCWGAGFAAQVADFGGVRSHRWEDVLNSEVVVLWGRNVAVTNRHFLPYLKEVKSKGGRVVVINPINIKLPFEADMFLQVKPGTDGVLALAAAHVICRERWLDLDFVANHVKGFAEYLEVVKDVTPEKAEIVTGIPAKRIEEFAGLYARACTASIYLGYGMQRYSNGGRIVRAIDSLAAITGNVGKSGGGVNYSYSDYKSRVLKDITGPELARTGRKIAYPRWGEEVLGLKEPPIRAIFVNRSNPVTQLPNTAKVRQAFKQAEFVVTVDFMLTDTALESDLVLPCTTIFEEENIVANGMNQYLAYAPQLVEPLGDCRSDMWIFSRLAERMGLADKFGRLTRQQWMEKLLEPLQEYGVDLASLKEKSVILNPVIPDVAWKDKKFNTPSGKIELYSEALALEPVAAMKENGEIGSKDVQKTYPLILLSPHSSGRLHSQFHDLQLHETLHMPVEIHPETAMEYGIGDGMDVLVESPRGQVTAVAKLSRHVLPGVLVIEEGWWLKFGGGVNFLTPDTVSDMGTTAAYYDCRCSIRRMAEIK